MTQCLSNHQAQTAPAISDIQGLHPPNTELRCFTVLILKALLHLPLPSEPRLCIELPSSDSKTFPHSAFNLWFHFSQTAGTLEIRSSYWETDFRAEKKGMTLGCNKEELNAEHICGANWGSEILKSALSSTDRKCQKQNVNIVWIQRATLLIIITSLSTEAEEHDG